MIADSTSSEPLFRGDFSGLIPNNANDWGRSFSVAYLDGQLRHIRYLPGTQPSANYRIVEGSGVKPQGMSQGDYEVGPITIVPTHPSYSHSLYLVGHA